MNELLHEIDKRYPWLALVLVIPAGFGAAYLIATLAWLSGLASAALWG